MFAVGYCLLCAVRCVCSVERCLQCVVRCALCVVRCAMFGVWRLLSEMGRTLSVGCYSLLLIGSL